MSGAQLLPLAASGIQPAGRLPKAAAASTFEFPPELLKLRQWVNWKGEKIPYQPNGQLASSTDPATWHSYSEVCAARDSGIGIGIGCVITQPYCGIDLDHVINDAGVMEPWAVEIVREAGTYVEYSPSKSGVHIWSRAVLPGPGRKRPRIEMYDQGRYFTVTGDHYPGTPLGINEYDTTALYAKIETVDPQRKKPPQPAQPAQPSSIHAAGGGLIAKSFPDSAKFDTLMRGDYSGYPSPSEAVAALVCMLAIRHNCDATIIDQKFRESGLHKDYWTEKWERLGGKEIKRAITLVSSSPKLSVEQPATEPAKLALAMGLSIDQTETGNSRKLVAAYGDGLRWCPETDRWFVWDGKQWKRGDKKDSAVVLLMKKVVQQMKEEADAAFSAALVKVRPFQDKLTKKLEPRADKKEEPLTQDESKAANELKEAALAKNWALDSEAAHALRAAVSLAGSEPGMTRRLDQFDSDPLLLNCQNGVLDLRTIELRPHSSADFCSRISNVEYHAEASDKFASSRFAKFLQEVQPA